MTTLHTLQRVLAVSVKRQGEKPLTNAYLLNIIRMANQVEEREAVALREALNEVLEADRKWGSS